MADEHESVIPIESDADVVIARQRARAMASELELTSTDQTLLATAISEVARNITTYAGRGEVLLSVIRDGAGKRGIRVIAQDEGPASRTSSRRCRTASRAAAGSGWDCPARGGWSTSSTSRPPPGGARRSRSSCGRGRTRERHERAMAAGARARRGGAGA